MEGFVTVKVIDVAREIVRLGRENPEHVYEQTSDLGCTYVREISEDNYEGDCIVGQAMINLGIDPEILHDADNSMFSGGGASASTLIVQNRSVVEEHDDVILNRIDTVQAGQDRGDKWGVAIKNLTEKFPDLFEITEGAK